MAEGTVTFFAEKLSNLILQEASVYDASLPEGCGFKGCIR